MLKAPVFFFAQLAKRGRALGPVMKFQQVKWWVSDRTLEKGSLASFWSQFFAFSWLWHKFLLTLTDKVKKKSYSINTTVSSIGYQIIATRRKRKSF